MQLSNEGKREEIWYLWIKCMTGSQILREMIETFGHTCPLTCNIYSWIVRFENVDEDIHDGPHRGLLTPAKIRTNNGAVQRFLM